MRRCFKRSSPPGISLPSSSRNRNPGQRRALASTCSASACKHARCNCIAVIGKFRNIGSFPFPTAANTSAAGAACPSIVGIVCTEGGYEGTEFPSLPAVRRRSRLRNRPTSPETSMRTAFEFEDKTVPELRGTGGVLVSMGTAAFRIGFCLAPPSHRLPAPDPTSPSARRS